MGVTWTISTLVCVHTFDRHNSAARYRNNVLPHETPRERFQQEEDKERAESMTNIRLYSAPHATADTCWQRGPSHPAPIESLS